jgi:outer membrane lipoprotein-sorting protein
VVEPRRPSRSSVALRAVVVVLAVVSMVGCASVRTTRPAIAPEATAALARLEEWNRGFSDLRALADIKIRQDAKVQRLSGPLLLRAPVSLRFEALAPFGIPVALVASDGQSVTVWQVVDNRAYLLPASADAARRWLGLAVGGEDVVMLLGGRVRPLAEPQTVEMLPPDVLGPSLRLVNGETTQRIWLDPVTGQPRQVEWTGTKTPTRVIFDQPDPAAPPAGLTLSTLDGKIEADIRYRNAQMNPGLDPGLLSLTLPESVRIRDFR